MDYQIKSGSLGKLGQDCIVVGAYQDGALSGSAEELDRLCKGCIKDLRRAGEFAGRLGETLNLYKPPMTGLARVLLVGLGPHASFDEASFRRAAHAAVSAIKRGGAARALLCLPELAPASLELKVAVRQVVIAAEGTCYRFERFKTSKSGTSRTLNSLVLRLPEAGDATAAAQGLREGLAIGHAMNRCKDLANLPANICTPSYLASQAQSLKTAHPKLHVQSLNEAQMQKLGMGALLAVALGSEEPARLIVLEHRGAARTRKPVVLVGKGITFDTGGISLKPGLSMDEMKFDMCGAASVLAAVQLAAELALPINLVGILAAAENMPSGRATRPGDVVTSLSGQTVEILNTDAEGRLVLCDALTYAERFDPELVIDVATLTGACVVALGSHASGLLGTDDALCDSLLEAGRASGDRAWRLPLWEDYQESLKSNFADMANIGGKSAGTITAACFLSRYTRKFRWAHLDIAGTAWHSGDRKGATGRPVPLLAHFLLQQADSATQDSVRRKRARKA